MRGTREVIESHLALREAGELERDLATNYSPDVVVLTWGEGVLRGHDALRRTAEVLAGYLGSGGYRHDQLLVEGDFAMLQWSGGGDGARIHDGADTYVVRLGMIVCQTIHYSVDDA